MSSDITNPCYKRDGSDVGSAATIPDHRRIRGALMAKGKPNTPASFWARVHRAGPFDCWMWTGMVSRDGYGKCGWLNRGHIRAHRIAYLLTHPDWDETGWVLHRCDTPLCCNPVHLWLGDAASNAHDMIAKGRKFVTSGENCGAAKLTTEKVLEIRASKESSYITAARYDVSSSLVRQIRRRAIWRHI